jgi:hypothetical protein
LKHKREASASGARVATIHEGGALHFASVVVGRDMGIEIEILHGIGPSDLLVANPTDLLQERQKVQVRSDARTSGEK